MISSEQNPECTNPFVARSIVDPKAVATSTFLQLAKEADDRIKKKCFDKFLCVSCPNKNVYIGFSYVLSESAILCEVYNIYSNLNRSDIVSYPTVIDYIQNIDTITNIHIGVHNGVEDKNEIVTDK